jgi:hypothetical protein
MGDEALPFGRFSPASGLWVDRPENSFKITGQMELYGDEATAARAASIQNSINTTWTKTFADGYDVSCNIFVRLKGTGGSGPAAKIEAKKMSGPSNVSMLPGMDREMTLNANEANAFTWTPAHEFGHVLGMKDRYSESMWSSVKGTFGGDRKSTADEGYDGNLMAADQGTIGKQNVVDLRSENEPSPYWLNDDDAIRDWVSAHSRAEISKLSAAIKLRAIKTLMGGWISDDDVKAMEKICLSVTTKSESETIQRGINLLDFTSIGQRSEMRVIFSRMIGGRI